MYKIIRIILLSINLVNCQSTQNETMKESQINLTKIDTATFGAGCFWCVETTFQLLDGVIKVESGYMGGSTKNPSYKDICTGLTGHAEIIQVSYDTTKIAYDTLLKIFWTVHDPTTLNQQGSDKGTQYRSVIFYHNDIQKEKAIAYKDALAEAKVWDKPIVTEISPATSFYIAELHHQNYYNNNTQQPYCRYIIEPKIQKFKKAFKDKIK